MAWRRSPPERPRPFSGRLPLGTLFRYLAHFREHREKGFNFKPVKRPENPEADLTFSSRR
jgi:hypothetical protein